jgi:hypothetical protein
LAGEGVQRLLPLSGTIPIDPSGEIILGETIDRESILELGREAVYAFPRYSSSFNRPELPLAAAGCPRRATARLAYFSSE